MNLLHDAAFVGNREGIEWVLANTTIDVNSTTSTKGETPIMGPLYYNDLDTSKLLIERGANLFLKNKDSERAIDVRAY
jgi:ankyrin repeat protein